MPYAKYCMQDTGRIWHTVFCVVRDYIKLTKQMMTGMMNITYKKRKAGIRIYEDISFNSCDSVRMQWVCVEKRAYRQ